MHQGAWIVWAACGGLAAMSTTNPFYLLVLFVCAWIVHNERRIEHSASRSFKVFVIFGAMTLVTRTALVLFTPGGFDAITPSAVAAAAIEGLRLGVMLAIFGAFNSVTDPFAILRLAPRRFHEPALAAALALSIAPRTIGVVTQVREAQKMRGLETRGLRSLPGLVVPVLATGMEEAVTLAESMDARGHGRGRRTRYRPERWGWTATTTAMVAASAMAVLFASGRSGFGHVVVSTYPLRWPQVSAWLMALTLAFCLPAFLPSRGAAG